MQFTAYNKGITAIVGCALIIAGIVFKTDLGAYADAITAVVAAITPIAVILIPNIAAKVADGGSWEKYVDDVGEVAQVAEQFAEKLAPATSTSTTATKAS